MLTCIQKHRDIIFNSDSKEQKEKAWTDIAKRINLFSPVFRTKKKLMRKWQDWSSRTGIKLKRGRKLSQLEKRVMEVIGDNLDSTD